MSKWAIWILVLTTSLVPLAAGAQEAITQLSGVRVDLWPDLDRPSVLVLITANLPAGVAYPATVRITLPVKPNAVAYVTGDGQMLNAPFETLSEGNTYLIEVETAEPTVRIEYYFDYSRAGDAVDFTYRWLGGVAVDQMVIMFREPSMTTAVNPDARFADIGILPDGQRYHQWEAGSVGADETIAAEFSYVAPPPVVSSTTSATSNSSFAGTTAPLQKESDSNLPVILAGAGGLLLGAGLGWALCHQRRTLRRVPQRAQAATAAFCHQCGARQKRGDAFCRQCGTRLR